MRPLIALAALCAAAGCSTPTWDTPPVDAAELTMVRNHMYATHVPPSRGDSQDIFEVTKRVNARIRPAVQTICRRMYVSGCERVTSQHLRLVEASPEVNAYADHHNRVTILGGLVRAVGSDDELASVIAHEYAHVMVGHVHQMMNNAGFGALMGTLAGVAIGAEIYTPGSTVIEDMGEAGYGIGSAVGSLAYTKEMEREADHVAVYIMHEAGYDLDAGRTLWVRLAREVQSGTPLGQRGLRGYFRTHPTTPARYAAWEKSTREVQSGQQRPFTLVEAAVRQQEELSRQRTESAQRAFESPACRALRERYPKCKWWEGKYDFGYAWRCPMPGKTKNWRACAG